MKGVSKGNGNQATSVKFAAHTDACVNDNLGKQWGKGWYSSLGTKQCRIVKACGKAKQLINQSNSSNPEVIGNCLNYPEFPEEEHKSSSNFLWISKEKVIPLTSGLHPPPLKTCTMRLWNRQYISISTALSRQTGVLGIPHSFLKKHLEV